MSGVLGRVTQIYGLQNPRGGYFTAPMKHFTEEEDIVFLRELKTIPPFNVAHGQSRMIWENIAERVSKAINRPVNVRSLQDHLAGLIKKFKKNEAIFSGNSGISREASLRDTLLREYIELMKSPNPVKTRYSLEIPSTQNPEPKRSREESESSEQSESEQSAAEIEHPSLKRSKNELLMDLIAEQIATSRFSFEEEMTIKRAKLEFDRKRLEFERSKLEFEMKKHNEEHEFRMKQFETQLRKDEAITTVLNSLNHLIKQVTKP